jgi:ribosomal protein S18 acetylase RimI-like enzyme
MMRCEISIRSAKEEDFPPLCELYCKSVRCNREGFVQDLNYHGCLIAKTRSWRERGGDMLVAHEAGTLVAMGALAPCERGKVELCKLHVDLLRQGRGIGRLMVERLIVLAQEQGFDEVMLHVTTTQIAAVKLYRSVGFQAASEELFETKVFDKPARFPTLHMRLSLRGSASAA